ncbi:MAG TPA: sulfite exporter TauE/SafE family protein [Acidimicrobiales bacterium]
MTEASGPVRSHTTSVVIVGVAAGFLSGLFGVGGGILIVPGLVLITKMDQRLAHGTSLAAVLPISAASLLSYWLHDNVDWPVALFLVLGAIAGAVVGTRLLTVLPHRALGVAFAIMLVASAIRLFIPTDADGRGELTVATVIALVAIGLATGVLAGLLGVGGGIVMVPAMIVLFGITPVVAKGTSLAVIIPTAVMGTWRNRKHRNADVRAAAILGFAGVISAVAGAWLSDQMSDDLSNVLFATLLVVVAARLVVQLERERRKQLTTASMP